jgi:hypothetical protein
MKNFMIIILLLSSVHITCYAQTKYSLENLEKASQEELDIYLNKSLKLQKAGKILTISGAVTSGVSLLAIIVANSQEGEGMEALFFYST